MLAANTRLFRSYSSKALITIMKKCSNNSFSSLIVPLLILASAVTGFGDPTGGGPNGGGAAVGVELGKDNLTSSGKYLPRRSPESPDGKTNKNGADQEQTKPVIEPLADGKYRIGKVVLDKSKRTVSIPARVNMTKGVVEYILVTEGGKSHESVFTTDARPSDVHTACLLLGMKELPVTSWPADYTGIARENRILVEIAWRGNGPQKKIPATQCVVSKGPESGETVSFQNLASGPWLYGGSCIEGGAFAANREGSLIAVIADKSALVNGIRPNSDDDTLYEANGKLLPEQNFKVEFILTLPSSR